MQTPISQGSADFQDAALHPGYGAYRKNAQGQLGRPMFDYYKGQGMGTGEAMRASNGVNWVTGQPSTPYAQMGGMPQQGGMAYAGGSNQFDESTGLHRTTGLNQFPAGYKAW